MNKQISDTCGFGKKIKPLSKKNKTCSKLTKQVCKDLKMWSNRYMSCNLTKLYRKKSRGSRFGSKLDDFYQGHNNTFLTPQIKKCLSVVYAPDQLAHRFGAKRVNKKSGSLKIVNDDIKYLKR